MALQEGFFIEYLALTGAGKPPAELSFTDGLNVVSGASDTGKSYAFNLIDFAFGARKAPRTIPEALGYDAVSIRIKSRTDKSTLEFTRAFTGSGVRVRALEPGAGISDEKIVSSRHDPNNRDTISALLLELSGLQNQKVRRNKRGETRTLSFRDIAFLAMVDEERIIADRPPQVSGIPTERTAELDVFRLLVTGSNAGEAIVVPKKREIEGAKIKIELIRQLAAQVNQDLQTLGVEEAGLEAELAELENASNTALAEYEVTRGELVASERQLAKVMQQLRQAEARTSMVDGLTKRFQLLARHYESDLSRLEAIEEAGTILESFPASTCPVCGALPAGHRPQEADEHFRYPDVRTAAQKEAAKVANLRADLSEVLENISSESNQLEGRREALILEARALQAKIDENLQPRMHSSASSLQQQVERRDQLVRAKALLDQRVDLEKRAQRLEASVKPGKSTGASTDTALSTAEMDEFAKTVESLLRTWDYPVAERVVFSENDQDIVVDGQPRTSHGKGVRALTCAAFIVGLMRHCLSKGLPHPGLVLLDSPLVVYREPDNEDRILRQAGVKDAFYRSLADGISMGQVIVFENEDPPSQLAMNYQHFSKSSSGRYGLVPTHEA